MTTLSIEELAELARRTKRLREAGVALVVSSLVLVAFLFIPPVAAKHTPVAEQNAPAESEAAEAEPPFISAPVEAKAAIVYDLATGEILYEKNADAQLPLASLTKLLTVYAALEVLPAETMLTVSAGAAAQEAPRAFSPGATLTLANLARLTLTGSLNDGAAAIIEAASNASGQSSAAALAAAASALGLAETYAINGSGLDHNTAVSGGYGSARDVARLTGALAAKAPAIALATTLPTASAISREGKRYEVKNTDPMIEAFPRLLLSKTGFTDLAGGNLALVFDAAIAHPIAVVVLGSSKEARFTDAAALVAATAAHFTGVSSL